MVLQTAKDKPAGVDEMMLVPQAKFFTAALYFQ
jgi:hypothetical protein